MTHGSYSPQKQKNITSLSKLDPVSGTTRRCRSSHSGIPSWPAPRLSVGSRLVQQEESNVARKWTRGAWAKCRATERQLTLVNSGELIASPIPKCSHVAEMVLEYLATFAPRMAQLLRQVCHIHIAWSTWDGTGQSRGYHFEVCSIAGQANWSAPIPEQLLHIYIYNI